MSDILAKLAGNKTIANLAFKQIKKYIQDENITMICIYIDNDGNIASKQYEVPVAVITQDQAKQFLKDSEERNELIEQVNTLNHLINEANGKPE